MNLEEIKSLIDFKNPWKTFDTPKGSAYVWSIAYDCHLIYNKHEGWLLVEYWGDVLDTIETWN